MIKKTSRFAQPNITLEQLTREGSWRFIWVGKQLSEAHFELSQNRESRQALIPAFVECDDEEAFESILIEALFALPEAQCLKLVDLHLRDFHISLKRTISAIAYKTRPVLRELCLRIRDYSRDKFENEGFRSSAGKVIPVPNPWNSLDGWPFVPAEITQSLCRATPYLHTLVLTGDFVFSELHHSSLQELHLYGFEPICGCGIVPTHEGCGRGPNLPRLKHLEFLLDASAEIEANFFLQIDPEAFPSLRTLKILGQSWTGLLKWVAQSEILPQLKELYLASIEGGTNIEGYADVFAHLDHFIVCEINDLELKAWGCGFFSNFEVLQSSESSVVRQHIKPGKETWKQRADEQNKNLVKAVEELGLSMRTTCCLQSANIRYIGELVQQTEAEMAKIKYFGALSLKEIHEILAKLGLHLGMKLNGWVPPSDK